MNGPSAAANSKDPRIESALREYLERVDRGETIDREEFISRHAEIATELRSFIAAEEHVRKLAEAESACDRADNPTQSFALHREETIAPQAGAKRSAENGLKQVFGRYRIVKLLGNGAMGTVYLAEDTQLHRQVALKTPQFNQAPTPQMLERFYREARAAATLRHPHICPVHDVGQIDGTHYISMAYIEGHPLLDFTRTGKPQPVRQALIVVRKLAQALQEAHDHGIVHRDLKPANIMIDKRNEPIIMDFGLARQSDQDEGSRLTQTGTLLGTPAYMSPEQVGAEPEKIGPSTDQYSLGVIFYELLTGQLPFRGSITAVIGQIVTKPVTPPSQLRPDLDPRIEAVCLKMMAKESGERYASISAVANDLATIVRTPDAKPKIAASGDSSGAAAQVNRSEDQPTESLEAATALFRSPADETLTGSGLTSLKMLQRFGGYRERGAARTVHECRPPSAGGWTRPGVMVLGLSVIGLLMVGLLVYFSQGSARIDVPNQAVDLAAKNREAGSGVDTQQRGASRAEKAGGTDESGFEKAKPAEKRAAPENDRQNTIGGATETPKASPESPPTIPGWGTVLDPDHDCRIKETNGLLTITIPGTFHDLYPLHPPLNAPRVLRPVEGDFSASVKVSGNFFPGQAPGWGLGGNSNDAAGLLVWKDADNFVRIERAERVTLQGEHLFFCPLLDQQLGGEFQSIGPVGSPTPQFDETGTYLRIDRKATVVTAFWSADGKNWNKLKDFTSFAGEKLLVGVIALSSSRQEFTASFQQFTVVPITDSGAASAAIKERKNGEVPSAAESTDQGPPTLVAPFDESAAKESQQAWSRWLKTPVEVTNSIKMVLRLIPPGQYEMGSNASNDPDFVRPAHRVWITRPFYIGTYEVTRGQFGKFVAAAHFKTKAERDKGWLSTR
jgi:serine/threonine protein kinase/regulation of enolase protein 1 (concanavalin A-like superfamily)